MGLVKPSQTNSSKESRREFLIGLGWASLLGTLGSMVAGAVRFLTPNVLFEPPRAFKIGKPEDYPVGSVTFIEERKVFILHYLAGFRALSATCTHLGCAVKKDLNRDTYYCPCHGSRFDEKGRVVKGPANRPLEWYEVRLARDGRLIVDTQKVVKADQFFSPTSRPHSEA